MKINITNDNPAAIVLFEAFIKEPQFEKAINRLKRHEVDVICTINGIEVDIIAALNDACDRMNKNLNDNADKRALKILEDIGFKEVESIRAIFEKAKWDIIDKIEKVTGKRIELED